MIALNRRYWMIIILLGVTAALSVLYLYPSKDAPKVRYAELLPMNLQDWTAHDLPVDDETKAILETDDVLMREYTKPGEPPIFLSVVFAEENRKVAHPPEVCLTGSGFEVKEKFSVVLEGEFKVVRQIGRASCRERV